MVVCRVLGSSSSIPCGVWGATSVLWLWTKTKLGDLQTRELSFFLRCDRTSFFNLFHVESQPQTRLKAWVAKEVSIWGALLRRGGRVKSNLGGGEHQKMAMSQNLCYWREGDANDVSFLRWCCGWCTCFWKGQIANTMKRPMRMCVSKCCWTWGNVVSIEGVILPGVRVRFWTWTARNPSHVEVRNVSLRGRCKESDTC